MANRNEIMSLLDEDTGAVILQNPNFFGLLEPIDRIGGMLKDRTTAFIASVNPISLGLIRPPGDFSADIVVGDGQPLGIPLSFGGPYLGFFATREEHVRKMPGRVAGETVDFSSLQTEYGKFANEQLEILNGLTKMARGGDQEAWQW